MTTGQEIRLGRLFDSGRNAIVVVWDENDYSATPSSWLSIMASTTGHSLG